MLRNTEMTLLKYLESCSPSELMEREFENKSDTSINFDLKTSFPLEGSLKLNGNCLKCNLYILFQVNSSRGIWKKTPTY